MKIIGRNREKDVLTACLTSGRPEFVVVYGRRRVGKTYLVKEYFNGQFSFYATGLSNEKTKGQLKAFHTSLQIYGDAENAAPKDWFEAFMRLRSLLERENVYRDPISNRRVVFLDELPWMDTARSDFKSALEYFWNSWASSQEDLMLIVCGSATSWIIQHMLKERKGFHNRVTRRIRLLPFTLKECEELLENNGIVMTREQIIECYMIFGGIPYYLNLLDSRLSLAQNVDELLFKPYGDLKEEYTELFYSLFKKPEKHMAILKTLSMLLKSLGISAYVARDRVSALAVVRRYTNRLGAVLLDAHFGGVDVVRLFDAFRIASPDIPVVVVSGSSEEDIRKMFGERVYSGFLGKPFTLDEIKQTLLKVCR